MRRFDNNPRPKADRLAGTAPIIVCILAISLCALAFLVPMARARYRPHPGTSCINNLRQLDGAKEQWALEHKAQTLAETDEAEVLQYVKSAEMPVCPEGGSYFLNRVGLPPHCSRPQHWLLFHCHEKLEALNNAVSLWLREHPTATASDLIQAELFGFGRPLFQMPTCASGEYSFDTTSGTFRCTASRHDHD